MSTKATVSLGEKYHLYEECFDDENIYLSSSQSDWSYAFGEVEIKISNAEWLKMIMDWMKMYGFSEAASTLEKCKNDAASLADSPSDLQLFDYSSEEIKDAYIKKEEEY